MTEMPSPDIRRGKKEPEWWRSFFSGLAVEMWGFAVSADQTAKEADFILRTLEPPPSGRLLDVPCGNGRLSVELARRGFTMTGVDLSPEFLDGGRTEGARQ